MGGLPTWAVHFNRTQYARFRRLVQSYLMQRGFTRPLGDDGAFPTEAPMPPFEVRSLASECSSLDEEVWPVYIARVLGGILADRAAQQQETARASYQHARPLLRLELWPERVLLKARRGEADVALRPWLPGLAQGLALQLDGATVSVTQEDLAGWNVDEDDVYFTAVRNVKLEGLLAPTRHLLNPERGDAGGVVYTLFDGPRFLASHALFVSAYLSESLPMGALFVVPHHHAVVFHTIEDGTVLHEAIQRMSSFALRSFKDAPRPLSSRLYWWHNGSCEHLPIEHDDDSISFQPPEAFVENVMRPLDAMTP